MTLVVAAVLLLATAGKLATAPDTPAAESGRPPEMTPHVVISREFAVSLIDARRTSDAHVRHWQLADKSAEAATGATFLGAALSASSTGQLSSGARPVFVAGSVAFLVVSLFDLMSVLRSEAKAFPDVDAVRVAVGKDAGANWDEYVRRSEHNWEVDRERRGGAAWLGVLVGGMSAGLSAYLLSKGPWIQPTQGFLWSMLSTSALWVAIELYRALDARFRPTAMETLLSQAVANP